MHFLMFTLVTGVIIIKIMMVYTSALQKFTYLRSTFGCAISVVS